MEEKTKQVLDITVGYQCNQNCMFCSTGSKRKSLIKTTNEIKKDILFAKQNSIPVLGFGGGEPTIRKDIFDLVAYGKSLGFKIIRIQTNGMMLGYKKFADRIIEAGANYFKLSIHGHNAKIHDKLTQVPGSFEKALAGIRYLRGLDKSVEINIVINTYNYKYLPQIVNFFINEGISKFCLIFLTVVGNARELNKKIVPPVSKVIPYMHDALDMINDLNLDKGLSFNIPFCLMEGYENHMIEMNDFNTIIANPEKMENIDEQRFMGKVKKDSCKDCKYDKACYGVWENYVDLYGFDEFKPVK